MNTISSQTSIAVACLSKLRQQQAKDFCHLHKLPLLNKFSDQYDMLLVFHDDVIELYDRQLNTTVSIDFIRGALAHRQQYGGGRGQAIAKAVGLKSATAPSVLDATAGLAGDAFVLATLGCPLTLIERSPVVYTLIDNAVERAQLSEKFQSILKQGFYLLNCDAKDYIKQQLEYAISDMHNEAKAAPVPDVIYIDPMYPERKKTALVKKEMQILQRLHGPDDNSAELLEIALHYAKKRVVVKRPIHAETLNNRTPSTCIKSKKTRYDIYTNEKM